MGYLLDANVFIAANNLHYGLDFCPAFWDWLVAGNESERVTRSSRMKYRRPRPARSRSPTPASHWESSS